MKKIAVVALDPLAGASYTKEVRDLFGEYAEVVGYSVRDGSAAGVLPRADLFAISTDAYGSAEEEASVDRKSTRLNSSHSQQSRMPSSA